VSNIIIVYSGVSVFLIAICKDFFAQPINGWYLISLAIFGILFFISFVYTIRFLYPRSTPSLIAPKAYYSDLRSELEAASPNTLTARQKNVIDRRLKVAYIIELEDAIDANTILVTRKQAFYFNAFRYAIFCIFPFIGCMIFHILRPEGPTLIEIVD